MINAHIHLFTLNHVPENFLPLQVARLLKPKRFRNQSAWLLHNLWPFADRDILDRYLAFLELSSQQSQEENFEKVKGYYPLLTRFVALPMDMAFMGAGPVPVDIEGQLEELAWLYGRHPDTLIPFVAIDPRRENALKIVKRFVEQFHFKGIKIYPRLGFFPHDRLMYPIYSYASDHGIPVVAHCSRGGVYTRVLTESMRYSPDGQEFPIEKPASFSHHFTHPGNYEGILRDFPDLRINLAHMGGYRDWDDFLRNPSKSGQGHYRKDNWLRLILEMMRKYPNLYADVSYTVFVRMRFFPLLSSLLDETDLKNRILFGSDFYMVEQEKETEKEMGKHLRKALGEEKFMLISEVNPARFLGEYES
jgi:predicted TIM-barrel fold metal-dependent hydrolase